MRVVGLKEGFEVYGLKTRTKNTDEMSGCGKIGALWEEFKKFSYETTGEIYPPFSEFYSVYYDYESDLNGKYGVLIGSKFRLNFSEAVSVKASNYAVFSADGAGVQAVRDLWLKIWKFLKAQI